MKATVQTTAVTALKRPEPGRVIGDLIVDGIYLRIWDSAVNLLRYEPRRDKQQLVRFHARNYLRHLPPGDYAAGTLRSQLARLLKQKRVKHCRQTLAAVLCRESGITLSRVSRGIYRPTTLEMEPA